VLVLALCGACHSSSESAGVPSRIRAAIVQGLGGKVDVLRAGSVDWTTLSDGAPLYEDDRLRTFKSSWTKLVFDGGSSLRVNEESLIAIGGGVTIERGAVEGELAAGLRLRTPTMEAETVPSRDIEFR
jgi:hypothetical protein